MTITPERRLSVVPEPVDPALWAVDLVESVEEVERGLDVAEGVLTPVDPPAEPIEGRIVSTGQDGELLLPPVGVRPVLATWLRDPAQRRQATVWAARWAVHTAAFHGVRIPTVYAARAAARLPRGCGRAVLLTAGWLRDAESRPLRIDAALVRTDPQVWLKLEHARRERIRERLTLAAASASAGLVGTGALVAFGPWWAQAAAAGAALGGLVRLGARPDKPLVSPATVTPRARRLTADVVVRAFVASGLCTESEPITFPAPITRDGPGWLAVIDLPYRTTAPAAIKKREQIAAGLDLDELLVWPERVRGTVGSARRIRLWVADEDPYDSPSGTWPLAERGTVDLFEPFPFGLDQRGRAVPMQLMFTALLVGSIPRMGKTFAARLPALAAALDVTAELHVWDGKGGKDWRPFAQVAHRIGYGAREDTVRALRADLEQLVQDMEARYDRMGALPTSAVPDSKITRDVASRPGLGLHPVVLVIDEFQQYSEHGEHGTAIVDALVKLAKVGPSVGMMTILSTQKPDATAIPTRLRDVIGTRFALKCMTWQASDAVLGAGAYSAGQDASRFLRSHKGVGWLVGADDSGAVEEAVTVRTFLANGAAAEQILARARLLREAAGRLTGMAAGEEPVQDEDREQILVDLLGVWPLGEDRMWSAELAPQLANAHSRYEGWTGEQLAAALKPFGIKSRQMQKTVDGKAVNRRGYVRSDVLNALEEAQS